MGMAILTGPEGDLHCERTDTGPPVFLIQGVGVTAEGWRPQVNGLEKRFETLIFDTRCIGRSIPCRGRISIGAMADDARLLMESVGWNSAHVVGHSMGGAIARQLALDVPSHVGSFVVALHIPTREGRRPPDSVGVVDDAAHTPWTGRMRRRAFLEMLFPKTELLRANLDTLAAQVAQLVGRDLAHSPPPDETGSGTGAA